MEIYALEVDVDHVHVYIQIPPQRSVGKAVGILKSVSARLMFKRFPYMKRKFWSGKFWQASYVAKTAGEGVTAEMLKQYIKWHEERAFGPVQGELFPKETTKPKH